MEESGTLSVAVDSGGESARPCDSPKPRASTCRRPAIQCAMDWESWRHVARGVSTKRKDRDALTPRELDTV